MSLELLFWSGSRHPALPHHQYARSVAKASEERTGDPKDRWNDNENPAVEGDQFVFVAVVNFVMRTFRKLRAKLAR